MNVSLIAIDLAKNTFQVCGVNRHGREVFNRPTSRKKLTGLYVFIRQFYPFGAVKLPYMNHPLLQVDFRWLS